MVKKHSIADFDPSVENWNSYSERFDLFLEAIASEIQDPAIQLSTCIPASVQ